jgi:hypothetical protein
LRLEFRYLIADQKSKPDGPVKTDDDEDGIFARPSFYAEFAPREDHASFVDSIYVLKDRGRLTASRNSFASPLKELAFIFREDSPTGKTVFKEAEPRPPKKGKGVLWLDRRCQVQAELAGGAERPRSCHPRVPRRAGAPLSGASIVHRHPRHPGPGLDAAVAAGEGRSDRG